MTRQPRPPPVAPHPYAGDGVHDAKGADRCTRCRLPETRRDVHQMPDTPAEAVEVGARIVGEGH